LCFDHTWQQLKVLNVRVLVKQQGVGSKPLLLLASALKPPACHAMSPCVKYQALIPTAFQFTRGRAVVASMAYQLLLQVMFSKLDGSTPIFPHELQHLGLLPIMLLFSGIATQGLL
jgi:hypothetical protein